MEGIIFIFRGKEVIGKEAKRGEEAKSLDAKRQIGISNYFLVVIVFNFHQVLKGRVFHSDGFQPIEIEPIPIKILHVSKTRQV
jgi:hypothetical protein